MGEVTVRINGRDYAVACEDGQEDHVARLGSYVDMRVQELAGRVGQVGDNQLVVMASLLVADELSDAFDRLEAARAEGSDSGTAALAELLTRVAERVEGIAGRLESA